MSRSIIEAYAITHAVICAEAYIATRAVICAKSKIYMARPASQFVLIAFRLFKFLPTPLGFATMLDLSRQTASAGMSSKELHLLARALDEFKKSADRQRNF